MEWKRPWFHCAGKCFFFLLKNTLFQSKVQNTKIRLNGITIKQIRFWNGDSLMSTIKLCTFRRKFRYSIARFKWIRIVQTICLDNVAHFFFLGWKNADTFQWKNHGNLYEALPYKFAMMAFRIYRTDRKKCQHFDKMWKPSEVNVISWYFNIRVNAFFEALLYIPVTIAIFLLQWVCKNCRLTVGRKTSWTRLDTLAYAFCYTLFLHQFTPE